jgi:hypothetical protein
MKTMGILPMWDRNASDMLRLYSTVLGWPGEV